MAFIVPGVAQFTIHATLGNRNVANVLHYFIDTTGTTEGRGDACEAMAGIILSEWSDSIKIGQTSQIVCQNVAWLDLNSEDGSIGSVTTGGGKTWPDDGDSATNPMPGNVAILVRKNITAQRGARKGRIYVPGVSEAYTSTGNGNTMDNATTAQWNTRVASFLGDTNQDGTGLLDYDSWMVVPHILTREPPKPGQDVGNPATGEGMRVLSLSVDSLLATQRRRLRG